MIQLVGMFAVLVGGLVGIGYVLPPARRPGFFRTAGLVLMAVFVLFAGTWIAAEALTDPGGPAAVGLIASWLVPLVLLVTLALVRPAWALPVLAVLTGLVLLLHVWFLIDPGAWRSFEDDAGPVRAVAGFVIVAALSALGWHRPAPAGWLLVTIGVLPVVLLLLEAGRFAVASWAVVGVPGVAAGILYLLAAREKSAREKSAREGRARAAGATTPRTPVSPRTGPAPPEAAPTRAVEGNPS